MPIMQLKKSLAAVAITAALLVGCQTTQTAATTSVIAAQQLPAVDIQYETFTLDNGLRVVVHEDRKAPIVAVNVWYARSEEHTSELQSRPHLVCRLLLEKKKQLTARGRA